MSQDWHHVTCQEWMEITKHYPNADQIFPGSIWIQWGCTEETNIHNWPHYQLDDCSSWSPVRQPCHLLTFRPTNNSDRFTIQDGINAITWKGCDEGQELSSSDDNLTPMIIYFLDQLWQGKLFYLCDNLYINYARIYLYGRQELWLFKLCSDDNLTSMMT